MARFTVVCMWFSRGHRKVNGVIAKPCYVLFVCQLLVLNVFVLDGEYQMLVFFGKKLITSSNIPTVEFPTSRQLSKTLYNLIIHWYWCSYNLIIHSSTTTR